MVTGAWEGGRAGAAAWPPGRLGARNGAGADPTKGAGAGGRRRASTE